MTSKLQAVDLEIFQHEIEMIRRVISFASILDLIWVMSPNQIDLTPDTSYEFEDQNERIRVVFHVTGAVKVKDCDINIDTDVLELHPPSMWHSFSSLRNIEHWPLL